MPGIKPDQTHRSVTEREEMFRDIIDYSFEAIIVHTDCEITYVNQTAASFFRTSKEALIGSDIFSIFPSSSRGIIQEWIQKAIKKDEAVLRMEEKVMRADETVIEAEIHSRPVTFGKKNMIQTAFQDITYRKEAEKILNDREKLVSIGQIAAGIAHEVKNPLTAVKGFLQLLKESHSHPYLQTMENELDKALLTLQNLLQVSKPDLQDELLVPIDFCNELKSLMLLFQDKLYDVEVEMDLRDRGIRVLGKKNLYLKAFFNLIKNALEAIPEKGKIKIVHYAENQWLHIEITDTGIGIPKDKLNMLGTPFFSSKAEGTGLGLTQVYTTIHEHGGHISVDSTPGEGTTFCIRLPITEET